MNLKSINGQLYLKFLRGGAENLKHNRQIVNELNVFPVPDGDTGDNMFMTINSISKLSATPIHLGQSAELIAREMLFGARGNSGVILSQIFSGLAESLKDSAEADPRIFHSALKNGLKKAYDAVAEPIEGTILTVLRDGLSEATSSLEENPDFSVYFDLLLSSMRISLDQTPTLLPQLAAAGVVDSGGAGLVYIFEGIKNALSSDIPLEQVKPHASTPLDFSLFSPEDELEAGYCTEFLLRLQSKKTNLKAFDLETLKSKFEQLGNSLVILREDSILKVHLHTKTPGKVLDLGQSLGEFLTLKIENMHLQHNNTAIKNRYTPKKSARKRFAFVSVASGEGLKNLFKDLGCDEVIDGGQSMNPSTDNFIQTFQKLNAETIFVFPNNKNIILSADQAAKLYSRSKIIVLPSKTIGEGYAALSIFDSSSNDVNQITSEFLSAIKNTKTGLVSKSIRKTTLGGENIEPDDYLGFVGKTLISKSENSANEAAEKLIAKLKTDEDSLIVVAYGEDVSDRDAESLKSSLQLTYPRTEFLFLKGDQPIYNYVIIIE